MCFFTTATGKTLEEIDVLFARSPEIRERLMLEIEDRKNKTATFGRRASSASTNGEKMGVSTVEKL